MFKGDFSFSLKDNVFDDFKAKLINEVIRLVERKVKKVKHIYQDEPSIENKG